VIGAGVFLLVGFNLKSITTQLQTFLGLPPGSSKPGGLSPDEAHLYWAQVSSHGTDLTISTSQVLALEGTIDADALTPLYRFYEANLPDDPDKDDAASRARRTARNKLLISEDSGYQKLYADGRLTDAAKSAIRDHVLRIMESDPCPLVRMWATSAMRSYLAIPEDASLLEAMRRLREQEREPTVKASIEDAIEDLGPNRNARREEARRRPKSTDLRRMLNETPDPMTSPWAEAHAYRQNVSQRTVEQLVEDYRAFSDPTEDEPGRQNATLKRAAGVSEIEDRIRRGEIRDLRVVKDHLVRVLEEEPDSHIRRYAVFGGLLRIAEQGGRGMRGDIEQVFERRMQEDTDPYVRAMIESSLAELKGTYKGSP
jgi:hypothetical protein